MDTFLQPETAQFVLTCEHGGNAVPVEFQPYFQGYAELLQTHAAYDAGALELAQYLATWLEVPLFYSTVTRLLADLNRSENHKKLFSVITRDLSLSVQQTILQNYYFPHRNQIETTITNYIKTKKAVIHIGVHSFTPVLDGIERKTGIGLLYDHRRKREKDFCVMWKNTLQQRNSRLKVRCNYPYLGISDGLVTYLRKQFPEELYLGIELEINQKFPLDGNKQWLVLQNDLYTSLASLLSQP